MVSLTFVRLFGRSNPSGQTSLISCYPAQEGEVGERDTEGEEVRDEGTRRMVGVRREVAIGERYFGCSIDHC